MTAQATHELYPPQPIEEWIGFLPPSLQRLVEVPAWATGCYAEGWQRPDGTWHTEDGQDDVQVGLWFSVSTRRRITQVTGMRTRRRDLEVRLDQWCQLDRRDGAWTWRKEAVTVGFRLDDDDTHEINLNSANLLLSMLGEIVQAGR